MKYAGTLGQRKLQSQRDMVKRRIAAGLCLDCGLPRITVDTRTEQVVERGTTRRCRICADKRAEHVRKPGSIRRPRLGNLRRDQAVNFYPTDQQRTYLDGLVHDEGVSRAETLRRALDLYMQADERGLPGRPKNAEATA